MVLFHPKSPPFLGKVCWDFLDISKLMTVGKSCLPREIMESLVFWVELK